MMTLGMDLKQVQGRPYLTPIFWITTWMAHLTTQSTLSRSSQSDRIRGILLKFPRLLTSCQNPNVIVGYLHYELQLTGAQVKRVLYQAPQVIGLLAGNLASKVEFLRATRLPSPRPAAGVVAGMPALLILGIDRNLRPKTDSLPPRGFWWQQQQR
jgi:mTERF domain-containing protein